MNLSSNILTKNAIPVLYTLIGAMTDIFFTPEKTNQILQAVVDRSGLSVATRTKISTQMRTCSTCSVLRPDRAHHCEICGGCVLKFVSIYILFILLNTTAFLAARALISCF